MIHQWRRYRPGSWHALLTGPKRPLTSSIKTPWIMIHAATRCSTRSRRGCLGALTQAAVQHHRHPRLRLRLHHLPPRRSAILLKIWITTQHTQNRYTRQVQATAANNAGKMPRALWRYTISTTSAISNPAMLQNVLVTARSRARRVAYVVWVWTEGRHQQSTLKTSGDSVSQEVVAAVAAVVVVMARDRKY